MTKPQRKGDLPRIITIMADVSLEERDGNASNEVGNRRRERWV